MRSSERLLMAVEGVVGASAVICGLILPWNSLGMSTSLLDGSPFHSFAIPGLVLAIAVGGSLLFSAVAIWNRLSFARISSLLAGSILLGWITVEAWIIEDGRPLQLVILAVALFIIGTVLRGNLNQQDNPTHATSRGVLRF